MTVRKTRPSLPGRLSLERGEYMKAEEAIVIEASCHCGAVRIRVPALPDYIIDCNCSICHRNGALWALYPGGSIEIAAEPRSVTEYVWSPPTTMSPSRSSVPGPDPKAPGAGPGAPAAEPRS